MFLNDQIQVKHFGQGYYPGDIGSHQRTHDVISDVKLDRLVKVVSARLLAILQREVETYSDNSLLMP